MNRHLLWLPLFSALLPMQALAQSGANRLTVRDLRISGSTSGYVSFTGAAAAGSTTYVWPATAGSNGQVLTTNGSGTLSWGSISASQWVTTGSNIYYSTGSVGVGTTSPRIAFDVTNSASNNVSMILQNSQASGYSAAAMYDSAGSEKMSLGFANSSAANFPGTGFLYLSAGTDFLFRTTSEIMRVKSTGNVGIGTSSPGSTLDVKGTLRLSGSTSGYVGFAPAAAAGSTTYTWPATAGTNGQVLTTNGSGTLSWSTVASSSSQWTTSGSNIYYNSGNVGVGTTDPRGSFHVKTNGGTEDIWGGFRFYPTNGSTYNILYGVRGLGLRIEGGADLNNFARSALLMEDAGISLQTGNSTTLTSRLTVLNAGNVGIGTTAPGSELDVKGTFRLSGSSSGYVGFVASAAAGSTTYTWPASAGSNGQVLTTNGSGTLSWAAPATGWTVSGNNAYNNTGSIGIGTSDPRGSLHVKHAAGTDDVWGGFRFYPTNGSTYNILYGVRGLGLRIEGGADLFNFARSAMVMEDAGISLQTGNSTTLTTRLTVLNAGNVGVGTTAPGSTLDVAGTLRLSGSTSGYVGLAPAAAAGSTTYTLPSADGSSGQVLSTNGSGTLSWATVSGGGSSQWTTSGTSIYYNTGNVGLGTTAPIARMHINQGATNLRDGGWHAALEIQPTADSVFPALYFGNQTTARYSGIIWTSSSSGNVSAARLGQITMAPTSATNANMSFVTSNTIGTSAATTKMTITGAGNVGIGTTGPVALLEVTGANSGGGTAAILAKNSNGYAGGVLPTSDIRAAVAGVGHFSSVANVFTPGIYGWVPTGGHGIFAAAGIFDRPDNNRRIIFGGAPTGAQHSIYVYNTSTSAVDFAVLTSGNVAIGQGSASYTLHVNGTAGATSFVTTSDGRLKKNVVPLQNSLEKILQLQGVQYEWKDKPEEVGARIGLIAQSVEKVFPEAVSTDKEGMKSVRYSDLVAPLIEASKALYGKTSTLEQENARLKDEQAKLKSRLSVLETWVCSQPQAPEMCAQ